MHAARPAPHGATLLLVNTDTGPYKRGDRTWTTDEFPKVGTSVTCYPEGNRYFENFRQAHFTKLDTTAKYRFKTEEEFKRDGQWSRKGVPSGWNDQGEMNHYIGAVIGSEYNRECDNDQRLSFKGWGFSQTNYVELKEYEKQYSSVDQFTPMNNIN